MGHISRTLHVLALAAALVTAGCGPAPSPSPAPFPSLTTYDVGLSILLLTDTGADFFDPAACTGTGEFADLHSGVAVLVTDAVGAIVGGAPLPKGAAGSDRSCRFEVRFEGLPERSSYTVKIGQLEYPGLLTFAEVVDGHGGVLLLSNAD